MTLTELLHLRTTEPRRFDALVGEQLFPGRYRHRIVGNSAGCEPSDAEHYCQVCNKGWYWQGERINDKELCLKAVPCYHADPAADLEAHRVACGWTDSHYALYTETLAAIIRQRQAGGGMFPRDPRPSLWWLRHYAVGDYATAALLVALEAE